MRLWCSAQHLRRSRSVIVQVRPQALRRGGPARVGTAAVAARDLVRKYPEAAQPVVRPLLRPNVSRGALSSSTLLASDPSAISGRAVSTLLWQRLRSC